jgi:hypothetical protein
VAVYQIVQKPVIVTTSEQWGPFEKIEGTRGANNSSQNEIGINSGVEIKINPHTIIENVFLINNGTVATDSCEKENTVFNDVTLKGNNISINNVTMVKIKLDGFSGNIKNSYFLGADSSDGTLNIQTASGTIEIAQNIFLGSFQTFLSLTNDLKIENNLFKNEIYFFYANPNYTSFKNNTIDISTAFFHDKNRTPNIDFSDNHWGTTDTSKIDDFIFDKNDSLSIDYSIKYLPILNEKHPFTPF